MNLMNIPLSPILEEAKKAKDDPKTYRSWRPTQIVSPHFLDNCIPYLASIPLERKGGKVSPQLTYQGLMENNVITTPNGEVKGKWIYQLLQILYFVKRGHLIPQGSQVKHSRLASFTPMALYAQKLHNGVKYSEWLKEPGISLFIGPVLEQATDVDAVPTLTVDEINKYRKLALTYKTGAKAGEMAPLTAYKCPLTYLQDRRENEYKLPSLAVMMILQLWLANVNARNTDSMILDPLNWDNVPKALDAVKEDTAVKKEVEKLPWEL